MIDESRWRTIAKISDVKIGAIIASKKTHFPRHRRGGRPRKGKVTYAVVVDILPATYAVNHTRPDSMVKILYINRAPPAQFEWHWRGEIDYIRDVHLFALWKTVE